MSAPLLCDRFDRAELAREFSKDERDADRHEIYLRYVEAL